MEIKKIRKIIDDYRKTIDIGNKEIKKKKLLEDLNSYNFQNVDDFLKYNFLECLKEVDRCYKVLNPEGQIPGCDLCIGRNNPCLVETCTRNELFVLPPEESQIYQDCYSVKLYENSIIGHPIDFFHWQNFEGNTPPDCLGSFVLIEKTNFDIFWGMKDLGVIGKIGQKIREKK